LLPGSGDIVTLLCSTCESGFAVYNARHRLVNLGLGSTATVANGECCRGAAAVALKPCWCLHRAAEPQLQTASGMYTSRKKNGAVALGLGDHVRPLCVG